MISTVEGIHKYDDIVNILSKDYDHDIENKLLFMVLGGSRLYGTQREDSDWDYVAVTTIPVKNKVNPQAPQDFTTPTNYAFQSTHSIDVFEDITNNFNVSFFDLEYFTLLLRQHHIAILECLYAPSKFVLLNKLSFPDENWRLDFDVLKRTTIWEANRKFNIAEKRHSEGKFLKAKKLMFLAIRMLMYGIEILNKGRIEDYHVANHHWKEIVATDDSTWEDLYKSLKPIYKDYEKKIRVTKRYFGFFTVSEIFEKVSIVLGRKQNTIPEYKITEKIPNTHQFIEEIYNSSLLEVLKKYNLGFARHSTNKNIVSISIIPFTSTSKIKTLNNTLVLDISENLKIIALGDIIPLDYNDPENKTFSWDKKIHTSEAIDGHKTVLYWYQSNWHVASQFTPDAEDAACFKAEDGLKSESITLREKFWKIWETKSYMLPTDQTRCYLFELVCPDFRKVTFYPEPTLFYTGSISLVDFKWKIPTDEKLNWDCVQSYPEFTNEADIISATKSLNPFVKTGYIVSDLLGNKLVFKSEQFVAIEISVGFQNKQSSFNLGADNFEDDSLLEAIRMNKRKEFLLYYPKWTPFIEQQERKYNEVVSFIKERFEALNSSLNYPHPEFAKKIKTEEPWLQPILFEWKKDSGVRPPQYYLAALTRKRWRNILSLFYKK